MVCADIDPPKVERLNRGEIPIVEHRLDELVSEGLRKGNLRFVLGAAAAVEDCEIAFLCVPTPQGDDGSADLTVIRARRFERTGRVRVLALGRHWGHPTPLNRGLRSAPGDYVLAPRADTQTARQAPTGRPTPTGFPWPGQRRRPGPHPRRSGA